MDINKYKFCNKVPKVHFFSMLKDGVYECYLASDEKGYVVQQIVGKWDDNRKTMKYVINDEISELSLFKQIKARFKC